jgi:hypothetical protein
MAQTMFIEAGGMANEKEYSYSVYMRFIKFG